MHFIMFIYVLPKYRYGVCTSTVYQCMATKTIILTASTRTTADEGVS